MTYRSDLKKRIRARQARTVESYTTARMHVLRARDGTPTATERVLGVVAACSDRSARLHLLGEAGALVLRPPPIPSAPGTC